MSAINSWNVRSLSSLQLAAQPPSTSPPICSSPFDVNNVAAAVSSSNNVRTRRRSWRGRGKAGLNRRINYEYDNEILTNQLISRNKRNVAISDVDDDMEYKPSLAEMKAGLGPIGLLVANAVEVGIATAGSYMSGGVFGYVIGAAFGVPNLFKDVPNTMQPPPLKGKAMGEIQKRIGYWNSKAFAQGKSWATLSASFSGFHALTRVCRGGVEDKWNSIIGSACTGAYLSRQG